MQEIQFKNSKINMYTADMWILCCMWSYWIQRCVWECWYCVLQRTCVLLAYS